MNRSTMKAIAMGVACSYSLATGASALAHDTGMATSATEVETSTPTEAGSAAPECKQINTGGPIAGIVVASVFWPFLPLSLPLWITQGKKLKRRKAERYEQAKRGCPPQ